jgi:hypothetical protein
MAWNCHWKMGENYRLLGEIQWPPGGNRHLTMGENRSLRVEILQGGWCGNVGGE